MEFHCTDEKCLRAQQVPYRLSIPIEAIMDEVNIAAPFCPHCNSPLTKSKQNEDTDQDIKSTKK